MARLKSVLVWLLLVGLTGCTVTEPVRRSTLQTWIGRHYVDVLVANGRPLEVYGDGLTGRVLVYQTVSWLPSSGVSPSLPADTLAWYASLIWDAPMAARTPPTHVVRSLDLLYVDKDGYVYSFQSNESDRQVRQQFEANGVILGAILVVVALLLLAVTSAEEGY